jgi:peptide/nickel transport system ATP-binding protein
MPRLEDAEAEGSARKRLAEIPGMVPSLKEELRGCLFAPRCSYAQARCREAHPPLEEHASGHWAACWEARRL